MPHSMPDVPRHFLLQFRIGDNEAHHGDADMLLGAGTARRAPRTVPRSLILTF